MNEMSYRKIFIVEQRLRKNIVLNKEKLETMDRIREYLSQIDHKSEVISENSASDMLNLITDLKGSALSEAECQMIYEIANNED